MKKNHPKGKRSSQPSDHGQNALSRRHAVALGIGSFLAIPFGRDKASKAPRTIRAAESRAPRFVAQDKKERREKNRAVFVQTEFKGQFVVRANSSTPTLHFARQDGRVRLSSPASGEPRFVPLSDVEATSGKGRVAPDEPWLWEVAALERLEAGDAQAALQILDAGARATLQTRNPNLRILDLWARLSVRLGRDTDSLLSQTLGSAAGAQSEQLKGRHSLWGAPETPWRKRWANKERTLIWYHPLDRENNRARPVNIV